MVIYRLYDSQCMGRELRVAHYIFTAKHKRLKGEYSARAIEINLNEIVSFPELLDTIIHEETHRAIASVTMGQTTAKGDHFIMKQIDSEFW